MRRREQYINNITIIKKNSIAFEYLTCPQLPMFLCKTPVPLFFMHFFVGFAHDLHCRKTKIHHSVMLLAVVALAVVVHDCWLRRRNKICIYTYRQRVLFPLMLHQFQSEVRLLRITLELRPHQFNTTSAPNVS